MVYREGENYVIEEESNEKRWYLELLAILILTWTKFQPLILNISLPKLIEAKLGRQEGKTTSCFWSSSLVYLLPCVIRKRFVLKVQPLTILMPNMFH